MPRKTFFRLKRDFRSPGPDEIADRFNKALEEFISDERKHGIEVRVVAPNDNF